MNGPSSPRLREGINWLRDRPKEHGLQGFPTRLSRMPHRKHLDGRKIGLRVDSQRELGIGCR